MTRDERIDAALTVNSATYPAETNIRDAAAAALEAALADLGGLDGLERLDWRDRERRKVDEDFRELRADRDRLREALRVYVGVGPHSPAKREWDAMCAALHESEAGT